MAIFKGGKDRDDTFTGTSKADRFEFDPLDLTRGDTIVGGEGRAVDVLLFTTAGAIGVTSLASVSGIERIELADGGANSLVLTDDLVASANGGRVTVVGGDGENLIYAADLFDSRAIDFVSRGGIDYVFGGEGDDSFTFDIATLNALDLVEGGKGTNTLRLSGSGSVGEDRLTGIGAISSIELSDSGVALMVTDSLARGNDTGGLVVTGGAGADTINASSVTTTALSLFGGAGDDTITGGSFGALADGGAGADTIVLGQGGVVYDRDDVRVSTGRGTLYVRGAATVDVGDIDDQTAGDNAVVTGFYDIDASASKVGVTLTGLNYGALIGGAGRDTITGGSYIEGGAGADTLIGSAGLPGTMFVLNEDDFARGEIIRGRGDYGDTLVVTGSADLRLGTVEGISTMVVYSVAGKDATIELSAAQARTLNTIQGAAATGTTITVHVKLAHGDTLNQNLSSYSATLAIDCSAKNDTLTGLNGNVVVHGGAGNDTLSTSGSIYGDDGDDTIFGNLRAGPRDGGSGSDALILEGYAFDHVTIDLSMKSQGVSGVSAMSGFENIDLSRVQNGGVTATGSAAANTIKGTFEADVLSGGDGNDTLSGVDSYSGGFDVLDGGRGDDLLLGSSGFGAVKLTGGTGSDTFRWSTRANDFGVDPMDGVTDFKPSSDHLQFLRSAFGFFGRAFDTLVVSDGARTDITGADLILYKGGALDGSDDVVDYINAAAGGSKTGVFIAGLNSEGQVVLYHSQSGQDAFDGSISAIANLGDIGRLTDLTLADFGFI